MHHAQSSRRGRVVLAATAAVAVAGIAMPCLAQNLTWDASSTTPATPTDGSGDWNTTTGLHWSDGLVDSAWINGSTAAIGNGGAAGTITINDLAGTVSAAGINFNSVGSGSYTIAANGTNTLTLTGAAQIGVATTVSGVITAPIAGGAGFNLAGPGTLILGGNNTYTGNTAINGGTLIVNAGSNLGAATNSVSLGVSNTGTNSADATGALVLAPGASVTIGSFKSATNNATGTNSLIIGSGASLNVNSNLDGTGVNGAFVVGAPTGGIPVVTNLVISGDGALNVTGGTNNSSFVVGIAANNTSTALMTPVLNMSGLANFSFTTGSGAVPSTAGGNEFAVGVGTNAKATATLAANNVITAGTIDVGDNSTGTPGQSGTVGTNNSSNANTLNLGSGANTLNANAILAGIGRAQGFIGWAAGVNTGTLQIRGAAGGTSAADITVGVCSTGTPAGSASAITFNGHDVNIQAGNVVVGHLAGGTGGNATNQTKGGQISFDTGVFNIQTLELAKATSGTGFVGSAVAGTFTVGTSATSTGSLNVTGNFYIASNSGGTSPSKGTFNVKGGTANIFTNIIDKSTSANTTNTTVALTGGTLNMNGFAIGPITAAGNTGAVGTRRVTTITLPTASAVLMNLGGTGINDAGLTMNSTGTLILEGNNTYTGGTTISTGVLQVGQSTDTAALTKPLGDAAGAVTNNAALNFASSQLVSVPNVISGTGSVNQTGTGTTTLAQSNTYSGVTSVQAGHLVLAGHAKDPVLSGAGGADIRGGRLVLDYNDTGTSVGPQVKGILTTGFSQTPPFSTGQLRTSNPADPAKGLGWKDDATAKQVTVAYTYFGDANLDGQVDVTDLGALATNWQTSNVWSGGDFNYDGFVDVSDLGALATNWQLGVGNPLGPASFSAALASVGLGNVSVPEPASIGAIALSLAAAASRRRNRRK